MEEVEITIYIDRSLDLVTTKKVRVGRTVGFLKHMLSKETGTPRQEITVALLPPSGRILSDDEVITQEFPVVEIRPTNEDPQPAAANSTPAPAPAPAPVAAVPVAKPTPGPAVMVPPPPQVSTPAPTPAAKAPPQPAKPRNPQWEVTGGADKGGILVRTGLDLKSPPEGDRLSTGATIEQLELIGDRLHFKLVNGTGPQEGWVSTKIGGKELVQLLPDEAALAEQAAKEDEEWKSWTLGRKSSEDASDVRDTSGERILAARGRPYEVLGLEPGSSNATIKRAYHALALLHHPDKGGDSVVFKAISDAYKSLTEAKDESGGWRDLEGQAVGPWPAHLNLETKGVTAMLFDTFGCPPWDSRRLYTGGYLEGNVKCWELSKGEPGKDRPPPRLVGEIAVGGFINDIAAISPYGLMTAQSAGMKPLPGESLRCWNMRRTPFKVKKITQSQLADAENTKGRETLKAAAANKGVPTTPSADASKGEIVARETALASREEAGDDEDQALVRAHQDEGYLMLSEMVYIHYRGVRCISLWPKPANRESIPIVAATVSKDVMAVSRIGDDGCSLQTTPPLWRTDNPHTMTDVNAMVHENIDRIWTGDNSGILKMWDVNSGRTESVGRIDGAATGWLSGICIWPEMGLLVASHSSGLGICDLKAGSCIRQQYTKESVGKVCQLNNTSNYLFAGIGSELNMYDLRVLGTEGLNAKPKIVAQWSLPSQITSVTCVGSAKGHILVAAGCLSGKVAAFDTT